MLTLPEEFSRQISGFAPLFSKSVFENAKTLLLGAILSLGRRTVCACLRSVGLSQEQRFHKYHWVLSLAEWCPRQAARVLTRLLIARFCPAGSPLIMGIDETLERRWGRCIHTRGIYRDGKRSSKSHFVKGSGLRWVCLMLLTPIRWASRVWALPFLTVLAPSERYHQQQGNRHKTILDWARQMILQVRRWLPGRALIFVGDSSYAALEFLAAVQPHATFITRLRLDAALFEPAPSYEPGPKGGRPPRKGARLPNLQQRLDDPNTEWQLITIPKWYGRQDKQMLLASGTAVWYHAGLPVVALRWVLLKDPQGELDPAGLACTDPAMAPKCVVDFFIRRWTVEVTFEEARAHLGVETQRQWSDRAIRRSTPALFALFSLVTLWADQLAEQGLLRTQRTAWYQKEHPTFSDAIASVRRHCYLKGGFSRSAPQPDIDKLPSLWLDLLWTNLARAG